VSAGFSLPVATLAGDYSTRASAASAYHDRSCSAAAAAEFFGAFAEDEAEDWAAESVNVDEKFLSSSADCWYSIQVDWLGTCYGLGFFLV